jgi:hypothetical protein
MTSKKTAAVERPQMAARPCLGDLPYRAVVFVRLDGNSVPLFAVAGSSHPHCGAEKALVEAHRVHGGACFYCSKKLLHEELTIDHAEPRSKGGGDEIQNSSCPAVPAISAREIGRLKASIRKPGGNGCRPY